MPIKNAVVEIDGQRFQLYPEGKKEGKLVEYQFDRKPNVKITVTYHNPSNTPIPLRLRITPPGFDRYYNLTAKPGDNTFTYTYRIEEAYPVNIRSTIAVAAYVKKDTVFEYEPKFWAAYFMPKIAPIPPKVLLTRIEHAPTIPLVTQEIQVIAYLKNPGTTQARDTLLLEVTKDGEVVRSDRLSVTVEPLSSHIVEFTNFMLPTGTYDFKVTVKGTGETKEIRNVTVKELWSDIRVNKVTPERTQYQPGERVRLIAEIQNYGTAPGRATFNVTVDGKLDHTITVTVEEGHLLRQPISVRIRKEGYHNICVGDKCTRVLVGRAKPEVENRVEVERPRIEVPEIERVPEVRLPEITPPTVECAPGDVLRGIRVKVENGQYVVYVTSGGYEIPVAYTNRNLTYLVPIPATTGFTMMGYDPTKIVDPSQYQILYDAVKGVRSVIQDNLVFISGKSAYGVQIDGEEKCMSASSIRFLLEQLQDRYIIDLVSPSKFRPGAIKLPTKIPEAAKRLIPIEVGVPEAERERLKRAEEERKRLEEYQRKLEEQRRKAQEEYQRRLEEYRRRQEEFQRQIEEYQKQLEEYQRKLEEAKTKAEREVKEVTEKAKAKAEEEVQKAAQPTVTVSELKGSIKKVMSELESLLPQAKKLNDSYTVNEIERTLDWAKKELSTRTTVEGLRYLLNSLKSTLDRLSSRLEQLAMRVRIYQTRLSAVFDRTREEIVFTITTSPAQSGERYTITENGKEVARGTLDTAGRATERISAPYKRGLPDGSYTYVAMVGEIPSRPVIVTVMKLRAPTAPTLPTPTVERRLLGLPTAPTVAPTAAPTPTITEMRRDVSAKITQLERLKEEAASQGKYDLVTEIERFINWARSESSRITTERDMSELQSRLQQAIDMLTRLVQVTGPWYFFSRAVTSLASLLRPITGWE